MRIQEKALLIFSIITVQVLIGLAGYNLYQQGMSLGDNGVDWSLAIVSFWFASLAFMLTLFTESKTASILRNILILVITSISIYVSMGLKFEIEKLKYNKEHKTKKYSHTKSKKNNLKIEILSENAKLPSFVLSPVNKIATLSIDKTGLITRTKVGNYPEKVQWVIVLNNEQKLARLADNELQYRYYRNFEKGIFKVYLKRFNGKNYEVISNVVSYESK